MNVPITKPAEATLSPILVTGGTGSLGRLVVTRLHQAGRDVRVVSRGRRDPGGEAPQDPSEASIQFVKADMATGDGLAAAVEGIEVIVHCAGSRTGDDDKARQLVEAASRAGARHLVYITVVGDERVPTDGRMDRMMFGYFGDKLAAERVVAESGIPWTTLHATQFYDAILLTVRAMARLPVIPVPAGMRFQPIDTAEVADRLVQLALGAPAGRVPDMAGPRVYQLADLVRSYVQANHLHRPVVPAPFFGKAASAIKAGATLAPDRAVGRRTWEEFLAATVSTGREAKAVPA